MFFFLCGVHCAGWTGFNEWEIIKYAFTLLIQCVCCPACIVHYAVFPLNKHNCFCIFLLSVQVFKNHFNTIKAVELPLNISRNWTSCCLSSALLQVLQMRQCVVSPGQGVHEKVALQIRDEPVAAWDQCSVPS